MQIPFGPCECEEISTRPADRLMRMIQGYEGACAPLLLPARSMTGYPVCMSNDNSFQIRVIHSQYHRP